MISVPPVCFGSESIYPYLSDAVAARTRYPVRLSPAQLARARRATSSFFTSSFFALFSLVLIRRGGVARPAGLRGSRPGSGNSSPPVTVGGTERGRKTCHVADVCVKISFRDVDDPVRFTHSEAAPCHSVGPEVHATGLVGCVTQLCVGCGAKNCKSGANRSRSRESRRGKKRRERQVTCDGNEKGLLACRRAGPVLLQAR